MPNYALGQQVRKDDERIKASYETMPSPNGNGYIRGYFVRPFSADTRDATPAKLPGVIVIHENRGLNPHTEDVARRFALENFMAFAPDALTSVGGYPGDDYKGGQLFAKIDKRQDDPGFRRRGALAEERVPTAPAKSAPPASASAAAWPIRWRCCWARIWRRLRRSMARAPKPEDVAKIKAAILIHHGALDKAAVGWLAGAGSGAEEEQHPLRRPHLAEFGAWLLQ